LKNTIKMVEIIPAILTSNPAEAKELIEKAEGKVGRVQIDIIDGVFANNKTIDPITIQEVDSKIQFDFHLMVKEPVKWVEKCVRAGGDRIIGQIEMMENQAEFIDKVLSTEAKAGLAVDLDTPVMDLKQDYLKEVSVILLMSVKAGFGGQAFNDKVLKKIDELSEIRKRDKMKFKICVDGGVSIDNIEIIRKHHVDEVSIGRRIFEESLEENIKKYGFKV